MFYFLHLVTASQGNIYRVVGCVVLGLCVCALQNTVLNATTFDALVVMGMCFMRGDYKISLINCDIISLQAFTVALFEIGLCFWIISKRLSKGVDKV